MKDSYETLEFERIKNKLESYVATSITKDKIKEMAPFKDQEELELELNKTEEAKKCIDYYGKLSLGGFSDISYLLKKAQIDSALTGKELLMIVSHLECIQNVRQYYRHIEFDVHYLNDLFEGVMYNEALCQEINQCIELDGTVKDNASSTLNKLRSEISNLEVSIRKKMDSLVKKSKESLSFDQMTTRNDRLVLPVKSSRKNDFKGLIHDHSATGQTVYIEPEEVMPMNNTMSDLRMAEQEEVHRILASLTKRVKAFSVQLHYNQSFLEELDFLFAKAQYGIDYDCCKADIDASNTRFYLEDARHPLINQSKVVSNTIKLDHQRMLVISGTNTGGKSVLLKTAGLLSLMALSGMLIPCRYASLPMFDDILIDCGDEQSIEQSLSTFSSHMKRILSILDEATINTLVILDEIGSGTDPDEGESLAQAIIEKLLEVHCFTLVSTHFARIKTFAKAHKEIAIGSVSFNMETLTPTYHFLYDHTGNSYAFEIAKKLGFDDSIISRAKEIKQDKTTDTQKLMEQLEQERDQLTLQEEKLQALMEENKQTKAKYDQKLQGINKQKEKIIKDAKNQANSIVDKATEQVNEIVADLKQQSQLKDHQITAAKHQMKELKYEDKTVPKKQNHVLKVGDHVRIITMNREGEIVEMLKKKMVKVDIGGMSVKLSQDEVEYLEPPKKKKKKVAAASRHVTVSNNATYEVNVIGKRYDEAMAIVDKFLDDALIHGYPQVRIIHGMGTGALRKGVRQLLEKNKFVVSYRDGGPNEGGLGATMVFFEK